MSSDKSEVRRESDMAPIFGRGTPPLSMVYAIEVKGKVRCGGDGILRRSTPGVRGNLLDHRVASACQPGMHRTVETFDCERYQLAPLPNIHGAHLGVSSVGYCTVSEIRDCGPSDFGRSQE